MCFLCISFQMLSPFSFIWDSTYFIPRPKRPRKTIQTTPFQQHTIFSNTKMLWNGFLFLVLYNSFLQFFFFSIEKFVFCMLNIILYFCIYRNVIPQNLNLLLRLVVAKWTFAVWFHALHFCLILQGASIHDNPSYLDGHPVVDLRNPLLLVKGL